MSAGETITGGSHQTIDALELEIKTRPEEYRTIKESQQG